MELEQPFQGFALARIFEHVQVSDDFVIGGCREPLKEYRARNPDLVAVGIVRLKPISRRSAREVRSSRPSTQTMILHGDADQFCDDRNASAGFTKCLANFPVQQRHLLLRFRVTSSASLFS